MRLETGNFSKSVFNAFFMIATSAFRKIIKGWVVIALWLVTVFFHMSKLPGLNCFIESFSNVPGYAVGDEPKPFNLNESDICLICA